MYVYIILSSAQRCANDNPKSCALFLIQKSHKSDMDERLLDYIHPTTINPLHNIAENFLSLFIIIFQECAIKQSNHHCLPVPIYTFAKYKWEKSITTVYFEQSPTINHFPWKTTQWLKKENTHTPSPHLFYYSQFKRPISTP